MHGSFDTSTLSEGSSRHHKFAMWLQAVPQARLSHHAFQGFVQLDQYQLSAQSDLLRLAGHFVGVRQQARFVEPLLDIGIAAHICKALTLPDGTLP